MTQTDLSQRGIRCDFCDDAAPLDASGHLAGWFIVSVCEVAPSATRDIDVHACPGCVEALADQFMVTSEHRLKLLGGQPDQDDQHATMDPIGQIDYITADGVGGIIMGGRLGLTGDMDVSSPPPETTFVPTDDPSGLPVAVVDAWGLLANVSGGEWATQSDEWREAARRWRDTYLPTP